MITSIKLREEASQTNDAHMKEVLNSAADTIDDLCKQIAGCVRVAVEALKRAP